jgi:hypothetical protein
MALKAGDTVRLHERGVSEVLDGMLYFAGAHELYGTEVTISRLVDDPFGPLAYAKPLKGYENLGEFPLDHWTTPDHELLAA